MLSLISFFISHDNSIIGSTQTVFDLAESSIIGTEHLIKGGDTTSVIGHRHRLEGVDDTSVFGSSNTVLKSSDVSVIGTNINVTESHNAVAIGTDITALDSVGSILIGRSLHSTVPGQIVFGAYNLPTDSLFVIGNGKENSLHNAFEITASGELRSNTIDTLLVRLSDLESTIQTLLERVERLNTSVHAYNLTHETAIDLLSGRLDSLDVNTSRGTQCAYTCGDMRNDYRNNQCCGASHTKLVTGLFFQEVTALG